MDTTFSANGPRQSATLNYEISTTWEKKPTTTSPKDFSNFKGSGTG